MNSNNNKHYSASSSSISTTDNNNNNHNSSKCSDFNTSSNNYSMNNNNRNNNNVLLNNYFVLLQLYANIQRIENEKDHIGFAKCCHIMENIVKNDMESTIRLQILICESRLDSLPEVYIFICNLFI